VKAGPLRKSFAAVRAILDRVECNDREIRLLTKGDGYLLQVEYQEPDVEAPKGSPAVQQLGRKWYVSPYATESEIVETAFKACLTSYEHQLREHFLYRGRRVRSPHFDERALILLCDTGSFDKRLPVPVGRSSRDRGSA
jgi:hypothetical protein